MPKKVSGSGTDEVERLHSKPETRQAFKETVSAFQNQRFEELSSRQENDRAVTIYRERCEQFIEMGIPENWDGAVKL